MTNGFNINTNFNMEQFTNSISDFNKVFSNSIDKANENLQGSQSLHKNKPHRFKQVLNTLLVWIV